MYVYILHIYFYDIHECNQAVSWMAALKDSAKYLTFLALTPAILILPVFIKYM